MRSGNNIVSIVHGIRNILPGEFQNLYINYIGMLKTYRIKFKQIEKLPVINLDEDKYFDITDYELEWELDNIDDVGAGAANEWLASKGVFIASEEANNSKYYRFIQRLRNT